MSETFFLFLTYFCGRYLVAYTKRSLPSCATQGKRGGTANSVHRPQKHKSCFSSQAIHTTTPTAWEADITCLTVSIRDP